VSNGFMLKPRDKKPGMVVCRCRDAKDESYRHCGCLDCRRRRNRDYYAN